MPIIVQKYGGSSVADIDKIKAVAEKVAKTKAKGFDLVVVVSAMGNTTDELLDLAKQINPTPDGRELDMLVTVGERISMALLSMAIQALGHQSISFTGSQSGIITNDAQGAARIIEIRPYRLQDELAQGKIVIVAGYQGVSYRREVTTLGRGGSDTTAVALAAALGAEACEIYSDVSGVFSADPRVVVDAQQLMEVSYEEMQELARFGAKVLNAQAVEVARRAGIALFARSTTEDTPPTTIKRVDGFPDRELEEERADFVTGVAGRTDITVIELEAASTSTVSDLMDALSDVDLLCAQHNRNQYLFVVSTENVRNVDGLLQRLLQQFPDNLKTTEILGLVTAVGSEVGNRPRAHRRMLSALTEHNIDCMFSFSSRSAVSVVVPLEAADRAVNVVHSEFLGKG